MIRPSTVAAALLLAWVVAPAAAGQAPSSQGAAAGQAPHPVADVWDKDHVSWPVPPLIRHADVESRLRDVQRAAPDLFHLEEIGKSVEGRSINQISFGTGPMHVVLWSQMHGDEPTATAALFDLLESVRLHRAEAGLLRAFSTLTVHLVPMLNPDGAERFQRRNAQGLDINRDALRLQTPEGRALKAFVDRVKAPVGFNLHNQNWRTEAGKTGQPASISLLSVAFDQAGTESPGRLLTKKICAVIRDALEPLAPGRIARYDEDYESRAFGDNITKWGTSVVLIETGAWPSDTPDPALVRLNFVAIVSALDALASGRVEQADKRRYETLPVNSSGLFYAIVRNATVVPGTGVAPFTADVGIVVTRGVRTVDGQRTTRLTARIDDLGDLSTSGALESIDATGLLAAPSWNPAAKAGDLVTQADWDGRRPSRTIAVGEPADLVLLKKEDGGYRVVRAIRY